MTFLHARLDERITRGASMSLRIPGHTKAYNPAGLLFQNYLATRPVHCYDLSHGLRSRDDFQAVLDAFYIVMTGAYDGFLLKDWRDYIATQSNTRCAIIDSGTLQLQRQHAFGGQVWYRDITKPRSSPLAAIYRTRGGVTTLLGASVDTTTGIVTGISGHTTGDTYSWTGQFDVPVQFTDDEWTGTLEVSTDNLYVQSAPIKLEEYLS